MTDSAKRDPEILVRIQRLQGRLAAANERHRRSRLHLIALPCSEVLTPDLLTTPGRSVQIARDQIPALQKADPGGRPSEADDALPRAARLGCSHYEYWGVGGVIREKARADFLLFLLWDGPLAHLAARQFNRLAAESGRLYQTLPSWTAPIHAVTSPRNVWASVLYGRLFGTAWVTQPDGIPCLRLPFAASVELWRHLVYGNTPDHRIKTGKDFRRVPGLPSHDGTKPTASAVQRNPKQEARDRWIYGKCCQGIPHKEIKAQLRTLSSKKGWSQLESIQGIRLAALRYGQRNNLKPPPRRIDL